MELIPKSGSSRTNELQIEAAAGEYTIEFYPTGTYYSENNKSAAITPSVITLVVKANEPNTSITLQSEDQYDFPTGMNLTYDDWIKYFEEPVIRTTGGVVVTNNSLSYNRNTGRMTAGETTGRVVVTVTPKSAYLDIVEKLFGTNDPFVMNVQITDRFTDMNLVYLVTGGSEIVQTDSTGFGTLTWESENTSFVKVESTSATSATVTGVKETSSLTNGYVRVTASFHKTDGVILKTFYRVYVDPTVTSVTINPSSLTLLKGRVEIKIGRASCRERVSTPV